jgi:hypothetical protein
MTMTEQEEFEFRLRYEREQEQARAQTNAPLTREQLISQIPTTGGPAAPALTTRARGRTVTESAIQGAMAVPVLAGAARGAQLLTQGSRAAPFAGTFASAVIPQSGRGLLTEGAIGAAAGGAAEFAARQVPASYSDLAEIGAGAVVGAGAGGLAGLASRLGGAKSGVEGLFMTSKDISNQISSLAGQNRASEQAIKALDANPQLAGTITRATEIEKNTGISLPMLAASNGDTTISSYMQSQISQGDNSPFTAQVKQQYLAAEEQLAKARKGVAPSMQAVDAYVKKKALEAQLANSKTLAAATKTTARREQALTNIEDRIQELSATLQQSPGNADVGARLTSLIRAKQQAAFNDVSPKYTKLINDSEAAGIRVPGEIANDLRTYATDAEYKDVFKTFPELFRKIKNVFADETKDSYSIRDFDSLKRETNAALRNAANGSADQRILRSLKNQVDAAIDNIDPVFSTPYRAIDVEYARRVGLPFRAQGIVDIDRAKFVDDAVPRMTKNASSLKQTMDVVGDSPEGLQIVKDAFLFDIGNNKSIINTATGELNPAQLRRYLAINKEKIDLVPGLRDELENIGGRVSALRDNRTRILDAEKAAKIDRIDNLYTQAYGASGGISGVVRKALSTPQEMDNLLAVGAKDKVAMAGIKSAVVDNLLSAPGDRLTVLNDNKVALQKVFGADGFKNMTDVLEASQRLKDNPFKMNININTIKKSQIEKDFGTSPETSLGEARNHIMSAPRALINHVSRFWQNITNKNEAAEIQRFLLDRKALQDAADLMNEVETRGVTDRAYNLLASLAKNSSSNYLLGATAGGIIAAQDREREAFAPSDPALLEGFGQ